MTAAAWPGESQPADTRYRQWTPQTSTRARKHTHIARRVGAQKPSGEWAGDSASQSWQAEEEGHEQGGTPRPLGDAGIAESNGAQALKGGLD